MGYEGTLMSGYELRGVPIINRIVMTAHVKGLVHRGVPEEEEIEYLERRARGGVGVIVTEACPVHRTSRPWPAMYDALSDENLEAFTELASRVRSHGTVLIGQIYHCGGQSGNGFEAEASLLAPSSIRGLLSEETPHSMTQTEITAIQSAYADVAARLVRAGFDGVEIHGGHGYLIQQFLSPATNHRTDGYGGSLRNRTRFGVEVIRAVRAAVGEQAIVGIRTSVAEDLPGGFGYDEGAKIVETFSAEDGVDYLSLSHGTHESYQRMITPRGFFGEGEVAKKAATAGRTSTKPIMVAGRVHSAEAAEDLLRMPGVEMVGMLRALIADPDLPTKIADNRSDEVRGCISVNHCIRRVHQGKSIRCAVNPEAGRETVHVPLAAGRRSVAVVGGGPAGLEAAVTAARLGSEVTLFEATERLGGAAAETHDLIDDDPTARWLRFYGAELSRHGVSVELNSPIDARTDLGSFSRIVWATGSVVVPTLDHDRTVSDSLGATFPGVLTPGQLPSHAASGESWIVFAHEKVDYSAVASVQYLLRLGCSVTWASPFADPTGSFDSPTANYLGELTRTGALRIFARVRVDGDGVLHDLGGLRSPVTSEEERSSRLVTTGKRVPRPDLMTDEGRESLFSDSHLCAVIGDAASPRGITEAVREGRTAAERLLAAALAPAQSVVGR